MREKGISTFYASPSRRAPTCGRVVMPRSDQGVRRVHEVAGVLDVAAQTEEQAFAGDQLLVRQAAVWLLPMFAP